MEKIGQVVKKKKEDLSHIKFVCVQYEYCIINVFTKIIPFINDLLLWFVSVKYHLVVLCCLSTWSALLLYQLSRNM